MHKKLVTVLGVSIASLSFMPVAQAAVVSLTQVSGAQPGEVSINLGSDQMSSTGLAGTTTINFSSTEFLDFADGNATISLHGGGGTFGNVTIGVPTGSTFSGLDFAALFTGGGGGDVTATAYSGKTEIGTATLDIGSGLKQLLFTSAVPITSLEISSIVGLSQLKNFSISGLDPVPLPSAFAMFGTVLFGGFVVSSWRRRRGPRNAVSVLGSGI